MSLPIKTSFTFLSPLGTSPTLNSTVMPGGGVANWTKAGDIFTLGGSEPLPFVFGSGRLNAVLFDDSSVDRISDRPQRYVVIVDGYSSAKQFPKQFEMLGYKVIHVHSAEVVPWWYGTPEKVDFVFDGDIEKLADELGRYPIDAVLNGTDYALDVADRLSERLGVPNNDISLSRARKNKYEQILALQKKGIPVPKTFASEKLEDILEWVREHDTWPVVVKPPEAAGGEGVFICQTVDGIRDAFDTLIGKETTEKIMIDKVIVQEYLEGGESDEYVINIASSRGRHYVTDVWRYKKRAVQKPDGGMTHIREYNELLCVSEIDPKLIDYAKQVTMALGIQNGPSHIEIIKTKNGPRLVELNPRIAGAGAPKYVEAAKGTNPAFIAAMGLVSPDLFEKQMALIRTSQQRGRLVRLISTRSGKIKGVPFMDRLKDLPSYSSDHIFAVGDMLSPTIDLDTCPGTIFLTHSDPAQIEQDYKKIREWEEEGFFVIEPPISQE